MEVRDLTVDAVSDQVQEYRKQAEEQTHKEAMESMAKSILLNPETTHVIYEGDEDFPPKTWGIVVDDGLATFLVDMHSPFWDGSRTVQVSPSEVTTYTLYD